jgi:predicted 3-demethylubiquinone-9 3-methyltransferase (glyoxalase superfamily)
VEAATFYTSLFDNSRIQNVARSGDGSIVVVTFELGQQFIGLNSGPGLEFSEAARMAERPLRRILADHPQRASAIGV